VSFLSTCAHARDVHTARCGHLLPLQRRLQASACPACASGPRARVRAGGPPLLLVAQI